VHRCSILSSRESFLNQMYPFHSLTSMPVPSKRYLSFTSPHAFLFFPYTHVTFPAQIIFLDFITLITFDGTKNLSSSLCNILHHLATSSLLDPNIFHSILFSNPLNLCSSSSMTYQVSHQYKTKIYSPIIIYMFLCNKWKNKMFWTK
jgi:hypothetical protein